MNFDAFWKANYTRMCRYCETVWENAADVEEVVADVIYRYFDEFLVRIEAEGPAKFDTMRRWMNRRALLDLKTRHFKLANRMEQTAPEDDMPIEPLHWDTPESILCLAQRLPPVHPILIEYEPFGKTEKTGRVGGPKGANSSADKTKYCRERKKFLTSLRV